jgi:hypothetical protein
MKSLIPVAMAAAALLPAAPARGSVQISADPTNNMNCTAGVCTPTAKNADLNASDLANMLSAGDVKVQTANGAVTITVTAPFSWTSTHRLTLDAQYNVSFKAPVVVAGQGAVTIVTNDGGTGGDLIFYDGGKLDFWDTAANFTFNGKSHILVSDLASIAAAFIANRYAVLALAKDYDAGQDGTYTDSLLPIPASMDGTFEGLGHTISNFSAAGNGRGIGLFGQSLYEGSIVRDLTLSKVNVRGSKDALAGALGGGINATITNVHASGVVSATNNGTVGGLVGYGGRFFRSDSSVTVVCQKKCEAGGLVGFGGQFTLSHATGSVTVGGHSSAGGLIGVLGNSTISQSFATGDVATGKADKTASLGGLAGLAIQHSRIDNSYATGAVRNGGSSSLGGLLGAGQANIVSASYATGAVGTVAAAPNRERNVGGFIGFVDYPDTYTDVYWDTDTSGVAVGCGASKPRNACPDIQGLGDAQLKSGLPAGFDPNLWAQSPGINSGYPYLIDNPPPQ